MDTSGNIRYLKGSEEPELNEILLDEQQAAEMARRSKRKRKNWMRNQPCPCGSNKKFKRCCWSDLSRIAAEKPEE